MTEIKSHFSKRQAQRMHSAYSRICNLTELDRVNQPQSDCFILVIRYNRLSAVLASISKFEILLEGNPNTVTLANRLQPWSLRDLHHRQTEEVHSLSRITHCRSRIHKVGDHILERTYRQFQNGQWFQRGHRARYQQYQHHLQQKEPHPSHQ